MRECTKKTVLSATTTLSAVTSFVCLCIAVSTDHWLYALERQVSDTSATVNITYTRTETGLWRKCVQEGPLEGIELAEKSCSYNEYFDQVDRDGLGPTDAIILSLRRSVLFPLISLVILLVGEIIAIFSHYDRRKKVLTFVSGILFVIAGLCTLIGIILYIGAITEEAGNKGKSSMVGPSFQYWYGASFVLTVLSFTTAELTGVQAVYLYISRHKHAYRKKVKRLANSSSGTGMEQHQMSGGPLVNDAADQGPAGGRGGSQRGGYGVQQGAGSYQQAQMAAPNHYAPLGAGRPNGRVVGALDQAGPDLGRSPYLGGRHGLQHGGPYLAGASSVGRDLAGYADTASYNGSVLMRGSPLGSAIYRRSMDSLLLPSDHQSAASLGDVARRTTPV